MYDYDSNVIWSHLIKPREKADLIIGINTCYKVLEEANITPIIQRLDNEMSDKIMCVIKKKGLKHQIVNLIPPHNNKEHNGFSSQSRSCSTLPQRIISNITQYC